MLNETTRANIELLSGLSDSMIISYPITSVVMNDHFKAFINISEKEDTFEEFGVFSYLEMNQVANIIDDAEISRDNIFIVVENERTEIRYATTPVDMIEEDCRGDYNEVEEARKGKKVASFELPAGILSKIKRAAKVFTNLTNLKITSGEAGEVALTVTSNTASRNDYHINTAGEVPAGFNLSVLVELVDKLPNIDYEVDIYDTADGTKIIFCSDELSLEIISS